MNYWLLQSNPKYYQIVQGISVLNQISFPVTYHVNDMAVDDDVLIWVSGQYSGIYAVGKISASAHFPKSLPDKKYWLDSNKPANKKFVTVEILERLVEKPLLKEILKQDSILQNLLVIRNPNRASYKISLEEWEQFNRIIQTQK